MAFEGAGSAVKAKLGPFPVWVWGLIIGGAFVIWYWVSQGGGVTDVADGGDDGTVAPPSGDFSTVPVIPTTPDDDAQDQATNAEWLIQAAEAAAQSGASFVTAQTALMKYLNGQPLTDAERKIVDSAIARVGQAPEGVFSPPEVTPEPEVEPPSTTSYETVTKVSSSSTRRFGQSAVIRVSVRWRNSKGHIGNPRGRYSLNIDGANRVSRAPLLNGNAIFVITPFRSMGSTRDKRWIVDARYWPDGKAKGSKSTPFVITLK